MREGNRMLLVHLALVFVGLIYGANYSIGKVATPEFIKPFGLILVRVGIGTLIFWLVALGVRERPIRFGNDLRRLILCAVFGVAVNQLMFFKGLSMTNTISASIIMTINPIIVLVAAYFILKEQVTIAKTVGVFLGSVGAVLLILRGGIQWESDTFLGDLFIFINACSYGLYLVLVKPLMIQYHPITIIKWIFLMGFFIVLPFGWGEFREVDWGTLPTYALGSIGYIIVGTTVLAYVLNMWSMKYVSPTVVSYYIFAQPIFAGLISFLFLDEEFNWQFVISALMIFAGVILVSRPRSQITTTTLPSDK